MSDMGFNPQLIASGSINPYRFVSISGAFQGAAANAITDTVVGVTDGSTYAWDKTEHAISGRPISLVPSDLVSIQLGGTVAAGDFLMPQATGAGVAVVAAGATARSSYIALEAGASGEIIKAWRFGFRGPAFA